MMALKLTVATTTLIVKDTVSWEDVMMALWVTVAKKTLIANPVLIVIGKMPSLFVRRKKVKVGFVGQIVSVQGIVMT